jgi:hypothetical protein
MEIDGNGFPCIFKTVPRPVVATEETGAARKTFGSPFPAIPPATVERPPVVEMRGSPLPGISVVVEALAPTAAGARRLAAIAGNALPAIRLAIERRQPALGRSW